MGAASEVCANTDMEDEIQPVSIPEAEKDTAGLLNVNETVAGEEYMARARNAGIVKAPEDGDTLHSMDEL
jgi:hypothetical protein